MGGRAPPGPPSALSGGTGSGAQARGITRQSWRPSGRWRLSVPRHGRSAGGWAPQTMRYDVATVGYPTSGAGRAGTWASSVPPTARGCEHAPAARAVRRPV